MQSAVLAGLLGMLACGQEGPAMPPEPRGPLPPGDVRVRQIGDDSRLLFTLPEPRGPRPGQALGRAELIRLAYEPGADAPTDPDAFRRRGQEVDRLEAVGLAPGRFQLQDRQLDELADRGLGWTLRYAVRLRDVSGRSSALVVTKDLVLLAPLERPSGLSGQATADGIRLSWIAPELPHVSPEPEDPEVEQDEAGDDAADADDPPEEAPEQPRAEFNLYRTEPGVEVPERPINIEPLTTTDYLDRDVKLGKTYVYTVRLLLSEGDPVREGAPSDPLTVLAQDVFAPQQPQNLIAVQEGPSIRLIWDLNQDRDLAGYRLYRKLEGGDWHRIGPDPIETRVWIDEQVEVGQTLTYRLTAVDRADPPNESLPSNEVTVTVREDPVAR